MERFDGLISKLRMLATTQVPDLAWLTECQQVLHTDTSKLTVEKWNDTYIHSHFGKVARETILDQKGLRWERPDEGTPIFISENFPEPITLTRFFLFAKIIALLPEIGETSYAKVGTVSEWEYSKVYLNGMEMDKVISADALLGVIEFHKKNKDGSPVIDVEKGIFETERLHGIVQIKRTKERQAFF